MRYLAPFLAGFIVGTVVGELAQARHALIAIPIIHFPQGEEYGNPFERHVKDDWTHQEVLDTFPYITEYTVGQVTGAYWAVFP